MTDDELLDAYHQALSSHEDSEAGSARRVDTFIRLVSAEVALRGRFGPAYQQYYLERYPA